MLEESNRSAVMAFIARKHDQWDRISASMPGLQLIQSGELGSQIMMVCSVEGFYEGVVIGQLPHIHIEVAGSPKNPVRRPAPNERKPVEKRGIDLDDAEIDAVLACWKAKRSALGVVPQIYDGNGKLKTV